MPKLKEISLMINANGAYLGTSGYWYRAIKAPNIRRFGISFQSGLKAWDRIHKVLTQHMESVLDCFLSVRKVIIIAPEGKWARPSLNPTQDQVILRMRDVGGWCKRGMMEVEIVSGSKAERRRCTEGLLSFDMMDTLGYYPYGRKGLHSSNFSVLED
jgi:hypothetical protein